MEENVNDVLGISTQESKTSENVESTNEVTIDNSAENTLTTIATIILVCGIVATVVCFFYLSFYRVTSYGSIRHDEFNPTGFGTTVLADTYFSHEQMTIFRNHVITQLREAKPLEEQVIRTLQSLEMMLVSDMQVHPQSFYDLVNIIREHEEVFPAWHSSPVAALYTPKVFENKKNSGGYWF